MQAHATRFIHAYKQAPWRVQRQYVGAFLLMVIVISLVAALYLDVTARTALTGREVQSLRVKITALQQSNADLETQLAHDTSSAVMQQRAVELGYRPVKTGELHYILVPGYVAPEPAILLAAKDMQARVNSLPEEYSQSLLEWLDESIQVGGLP